MAEAVASLALASSILQVIDFGTKVVSTASKVYQASKRKEPSLNELEMIYKNLVSTLDTIETDDTEMVDNGVLGMKSLAKGCSDLAKELLDTWHKIGFDKEVKTKHQALWVALKHVWKDEKIRSLQARLDEFRSQLTMCLLVSLRCVVSSNFHVSRANECRLVNMLASLCPNKERSSKNLENQKMVHLELQYWSMLPPN